MEVNTLSKPILQGKTLYLHEPFALECGYTLPEIKIYYHTKGNYHPQKSKVIWVCHALTANSDVLDWWKGLFGESMLYDSDEYYVVCANILGSCYGSTGPLHNNPVTGTPYYHDFPQVTIRDQVHFLDKLRVHLGISAIHTCLGGSLGGQYALEWAIMHPELIKNLIIMCTSARTSPWAIALNETQRMAIKADISWTQKHENAGLDGLKTARAIALLSYRSYETYQHTQHDAMDETKNYKAITYQQHQGNKFIKRFNAYSYWVLTHMLDSHNVGRQRGSVENALKSIKSHTLVIGINTDMLFPTVEQKAIATHIEGAKLVLLDSLYGHDGFLIESEKITDIISDFYR
ncbi:MAG: homoserine O-acetyltransferase [Cytophagales bacterium]|nr:homoserine O-acetyltransferase [Cytophagales bacterium]